MKRIAKFLIHGLALAFIVSAATAEIVAIPPLPQAGIAPADSIAEQEVLVSQLPGVTVQRSAEGSAYLVILSNEDRVVYFFTSQGMAAHPGLIRAVIHPMKDPTHPSESDFEFHESYASPEADFLAWRKKTMFEFGRGFMRGALEAQKGQPK